MLRITGKNFVVGLAYGSLKIIHTAAPMVRYMLGWKVAKVIEYAHSRGWKVEVL